MSNIMYNITKLLTTSAVLVSQIEIVHVQESLSLLIMYTELEH
jgi:hypothetical protein